jgi:hypothetical protein
VKPGANQVVVGQVEMVVGAFYLYAMFEKLVIDITIAELGKDAAPVTGGLSLIASAAGVNDGVESVAGVVGGATLIVDGWTRISGTTTISSVVSNALNVPDWLGQL